MARFSESEVISHRFWKQVEKATLAGGVEPWYSRRIVLTLLFLELIPNTHELRARLSEQQNAHRVRAALEGHHSLVSWLSRVDSEQVVLLANLYSAVAELLYHGSSKHDLDNIQASPEFVSHLIFMVARLVEFESDHETLRQAFNYGFLKGRAGEPRQDVPREIYLAQLGASLCTSKAPTIADYYGCTGQLAINVSMGRDDIPIYLLGDKYNLDIELSMRLAVHRIRDERVRQTNAPGFLTSFSNWRPDVVLLNPPSGFYRNRDSRSNLLSAIDLSEQLDRQEVCNYGVALLALTKSDAAKMGRPEAARRSLIGGGRILAVIDLPRTATRKKPMTCWVIGGDRPVKTKDGESILFVDAEGLSHLIDAGDDDGGCGFVAALVALVHGNFHTAGSSIAPLSVPGKTLEHLLLRKFQGGYRDVPGLCRVVSVNEVYENDCKLVADHYVFRPQEDSWLFGYDWTPIENCLQDRSSDGCVIYLIGNNGEGKSLMLASVARRSIHENNQPTIAISFSASDRFPTERQVKSEGRYKYLGARTSAGGISLLKVASAAAELIYLIYTNNDRRNSLRKLFDIIGFSHELFLIPIGHKSALGTDSEDVISGVIRMASSSSEDQELMRNIDQSPEKIKSYKLGLQKRNEPVIIPFDELSSGEQHIILFAAKLVVYAEAGAIFLIDEPEISMHVSWQRAIPVVLSAIANDFNASILVATHSPILISSARSASDYCFMSLDREIYPLAPADRHSVETVLFEGFRTHTANNRNVYERCAALVSRAIEAANQSDPFEGKFEEIFAKLNEMRAIVEKGFDFSNNARNDSEGDLGLISKSVAAVAEIAALAGYGDVHGPR